MFEFLSRTGAELVSELTPGGERWLLSRQG